MVQPFLKTMETPKWLLWQTVKIKIKCSRMLHFIRVCPVCLRQNQSLENTTQNQPLEIMQYSLEITICNPSIYTMDHPDFPVSNFIENSIGLKRVNKYNCNSAQTSIHYTQCYCCYYHNTLNSMYRRNMQMDFNLVQWSLNEIWYIIT